MNFADLLARFHRPRPFIFDWAQTDLAHEPPSGFKIVVDPLIQFPGAGNDELLTDYEGGQVTDLIDLKTCPPMGAEEKHWLDGVLDLLGVTPTCLPAATEIVEDIRRTAYGAGYRAGHYDALEETLP